jgi:hypothetical protein
LLQGNASFGLDSHATKGVFLSQKHATSKILMQDEKSAHATYNGRGPFVLSVLSKEAEDLIEIASQAEYQPREFGGMMLLKFPACRLLAVSTPTPFNRPIDM